jgi:FixJ family two-component response regulator
VLDVQMPGMNGLEVQELLARSEEPLPVVFMTAHDEVSVRERALRAGAVAFLHKPFNDDVFVKTLNEALKRDRGRTS